MSETALTRDEQRRLLEALSHKRTELGDLKFSKSAWLDPHVLALAKEIRSALGLSERELKDKVEDAIMKSGALELAEISPFLYETTMPNLIESNLFTIYWREAKDHEIKGAPQFDEALFLDLWGHIRANHRQFSPLHDFQTRKYQHNVNVIFVPSRIAARQKEFGSVDTAAATPKGDFIFNTVFMQKLLDFAHLKQLKVERGPNGKKYKSNGGKYPDEYGYIEFLIMHELMHYSRGDFHYQNVIPNADATVINYAGDFRTNHQLVKSGLPQIPIGLFSDHLNMDRQRTYKELYDKVKEELAKVRKHMAPPPPDGGQHGTKPEKVKTISVGSPVKLPNGKFGRVKSIDGNSTAGHSVTNEDGARPKIEIEEISKEEANSLAAEQKEQQ